jgi:hypothetical protein
MCDPGNLRLAIAHGIEALASARELAIGRIARTPWLAEVDIAVELTNEQDVEPFCDFGFERRGADQVLIQEGRAQIGEEMQFLAQPKHTLLRAELPVELVVFPVAGRAEQDRIGLFGDCKRRVGERISARIVSRAANGRFFELEGFAEAIQHLDRFPYDLRADAVTGQHCYLHFDLL